MQVPEKYYDLYKDIDPSNFYEEVTSEMTERDVNDAKKIYGMVTNIDENFGKLLYKLEELDIKENTIVIFLTDNGPQQTRYISNLRGLKSQVYNGGIKVPLYFSYPKLYKKAKDIDFFGAHIDVLPTLSKLCNLTIPSDRKIDGIDLFDENIDKNNRDFFSYWTRKSPELYKNISLNSDNYKLVGNTDYDSQIENFELYDLVNDPTESKNLILEKNQLAMDMKNRMDDVYDELIKSKNLVNKPRIHLGSIYENPTILNRNDAGGQRGIWAQNEKYGLWRVNFQSGVYNFKFKFNNVEQSDGQMTLEIGNSVHSKKIYLDDEGFASMENIKVDEGDYDLIPFLTINRKNILPFWVEVKKL